MKTSSAPPKTIDGYIGLHPTAVQERLRAIRDEVQSIAPNAEEKISYGTPTFTMRRNIFHFAAFKNHIGLYPGAAAIEAFGDDLKHYKTSKGTIQISLSEAIPIPLVRKLVRFNLKSLESQFKGEK